MSRGLLAVILESSCLRDPAAALRGLAKTGSPLASLSLFSFLKLFRGRKTSPRTSRYGGIFCPAPFFTRSGASVSGMLLTVLRFWVTSSPGFLSPRGELLKTPHKAVVLGVRDYGAVEDVITIVVIIYLPPQTPCLLGGGLLLPGHGIFLAQGLFEVNPGGKFFKKILPQPLSKTYRYST